MNTDPRRKTSYPRSTAAQLPVSNHFPPVVRDALVAASRTSTCVDPMDARAAINHATARARLLYPELFID
jgi:hypothetical protein